MWVKGTNQNRVIQALRIIVPPVVLLSLLLVTGGSLSGALAQSKAYKEDYVKAAFIYNLTKFVTWPDQSTTAPMEPFTIYVVGKKSIHDILKRIVAGEKIRGRPITVRWDEVYDHADQCHILFLGADHRKQWPRIYSDVRDRNILTVGDFDTFCQLGGVVKATREGPRLKILLNIEAAKRSGLRIDSKLLRMATIVNN